VRPDPVEEGPVRDQPADEEDARERDHVNASVARARAARSNQRRKRVASARYVAPVAAHIAIGNQPAPPVAARRIASIPHVGARSQETGRTQSGRSAIGNSSPVATQTGYSSRFESAFACR